MRNAFRVILCLLLVVSCSRDRKSAVLQEGVWDPQVREALNELLASPGPNAYAVFDFDQTSIVHDISNALWVYRIEHLCYDAAPARHFLDGIPTPEDLMPGTDVSYAGMGAVLSEEYGELRARVAAGEPLESIRTSGVYLDFRARMVSLMEAMDGQYGSWVTYLWQPGLLAGYSDEEAKAVIRDAIAAQLGKDKLATETWRSPDGRWGGDSNGDVPMLTAFPEMRRGLIIDVGRSATSAIGKLAAQTQAEGNKGTYLLQPSFEQ